MMMTNGVGAFMGSTVSGWLIDRFFTLNNEKQWQPIWLTFSVYAMAIAFAFAILFKHKHDPNAVGEVRH
jgi:NHS family xanthosine MFS transporter